MWWNISTNELVPNDKARETTQGSSDCFVNLSPIFTIFSFPVNNDTVQMSHHFGCHGNYFGRSLCVTIDTKLLNYYMGWHSSHPGCTPLCVHNSPNPRNTTLLLNK